MSDDPRSKLSDQRVTAILDALEHGCTRRAAAGVGGIHHSTLYEWMAQDPTLTDAVEKAEQKAEAAYTYAVAQAVPKNWQAAAWWLERRKHLDYGRKDQVEMKIDLRTEVQKLAEELGLDPDAAIAEAEALFAARR